VYFGGGKKARRYRAALRASLHPQRGDFAR
jgi:hypothetical protein